MSTRCLLVHLVNLKNVPRGTEVTHHTRQEDRERSVNGDGFTVEQVISSGPQNCRRVSNYYRTKPGTFFHKGEIPGEGD